MAQPATPAPHVTVVLPPTQEQRHDERKSTPTHDSWREEKRTFDPAPEVPREPSPVVAELPPVAPSTTGSSAPIEQAEVAKPEVPPQKKKPLPETKPEEKSSSPELPAEEKASKASGRKKLKVYNGEGGRIHTDEQIDEILDRYLRKGDLPDYVSDRQRYSYRHHRRLLERRKILEQRGIPIIIHEIGRQ